MSFSSSSLSNNPLFGPVAEYRDRSEFRLRKGMPPAGRLC